MYFFHYPGMVQKRRREEEEGPNPVFPKMAEIPEGKDGLYRKDYFSSTTT